MAQELGATVLEEVHQAEVQVETIPGAVLLVALLEVILVADLVVQLVGVLAVEDKQAVDQLVAARQVAALLVERRSQKHALTTKTKTEIGVTPQTLLNGDSELFEEKKVLYPLVLILSNLKISKA